MLCDAVIFDCDGVLVDSEGLASEVLVESLKPFGICLTIEDAMARFCGVRMADCVAQLELIGGTPLPESFVPQLRKQMAAVFTDRLKPIEGELELLRTLTLPYCVASSAPREKIELSLSLTGLLPYLQGRMYSSYDIEDWKPSPGLFIHSARSMGVHPHRCAVIEDSWPGIQAGLAAGMQVFALQRHDSDPRIPRHVSIVHRLSELHPLLCPV